ncbi:MAG: hypothetical protein FJ398_13510 [Verrucomicrobia bacterium]|nr:hypothetical protein [Verrucomicrobiota bacterium]
MISPVGAALWIGTVLAALKEESVRIEQWKPHEHDVQEPGPQRALTRLLESLEKLSRVVSAFVLEQSRAIELTQQLDHRLLARRAVGKLFQTFLPDFFHGAIRAKAGDEFVSGRLEPKELVAERVLQDVPAPAAKILPAHAHAGPEPNALIGDAVPRFAEGGRRTWHVTTRRTF